MHSDIFESFVKIALEKGIISNEEEKPTPKKSTKTTNLYNVKVDRPKGMDYEGNIISDAHPESVIIGPSYDKLNALVENGNEAQAIAINIINRVPRGVLTNHKYAQKELLLTLVRVANDLDNADKDELRKLADACLSQMAGGFKKKADWADPLAAAGLIGAVQVGGGVGLAVGGPVGAIIGAAAGLGIYYAYQHLSLQGPDFERNHTNLVECIDKMIQSDVTIGLWGEKYSPEFIQILQKLKDNVTGFHSAYEEYKAAILSYDAPGTAKEIAADIDNPNKALALKAVKELSKLVANTLNYYKRTLINFKDENYKLRQISNKGYGTEAIDALQVLHGGHGIVSDKFDDCAMALESYVASVDGLLKTFQKAAEIESSSQAQMTAAIQSTSTPATPSAAAPAAKKPLTEAEQIEADEKSLAE